MSYEVKHRLEFLDEYDRWVRVDLLQDGYTGETISERVGEGFSPLHISIQNQGDEKFETIKATEIELSIFSDNFELEEISEASDREFLMKVYEAPTENGVLSLKHVGYVIPEIYTEPYVVEPYPVTIRAASIGLLNNIRYVTDEYGEFYTGEATLMTVLTRCLNRLGYELDIWDSINTYEDRILYFDTSPLEEIKIDQAAFITEENGRERAKTCMEVVEQILKPFVVNFFMDYGRWVIIPMELRGTNRSVRIFNYNGVSQSTGVYNPLNTDYNWIDQDQVLEFMPLARDVESLYEHGLPKDIVENHKFDGEFIEVQKSVGSIWYPEEWSLNDVDDFNTIEIGTTSTRIYSGIRYIADGQSDGQSFSTFFHSALVEDGAYIEQTGTRIIKQGEDSVRFLIDYSGVVKLWSGDLNLDDTAVPDDSIDHKFQIKIGSKYLTAEGSWTDTPTDIILNDLGDGGWRYPTSNVNVVTGEVRSGFATNFRQFEIVSDIIEEEGTAYVRIYKPVSENEGPGPGGGDTYCTVAYSEFSMLLNPGGQSATESTLFFGERDVETYADDFEFTLESGDGPTNFHVSSFLIDTEYGDNLKTENWIRGNLEGGISEVAINAIFLEHNTKSNLIRGTQKVRGLFDRWFIEYQKGYTVLAGTYDQRLCRFSGEMVQVLNSEPEIWGTEELEPGPNFEVTVGESIFSAFDDELFYVVSYEDSDNIYLHKCNGNVDDGITILNSYKFPTDAVESGLSSVLSRSHVSVLRNGNVVVFGSNDKTRVFLFDEDVSLIDDITISKASFPYYSLTHLAVDYDDSLYIVNEEGVDDFHIYKYDYDLNLLWDTAVDSMDSSAKTFLGLNVTKNHVIWAHSDLSNTGSGMVFNKTTGAFVKSLTGSLFTAATVNVVQIDNYTDGKVAIYRQNPSTNEGFINVYDEDLNLLNSYVFDGDIRSVGVKLGANADGTFLIENEDLIIHFDASFTQIATWSIGSDLRNTNLGWTTDPNLLIAHKSNSSNKTGELYLVDLSNQTATSIGSYASAGIEPATSLAFGMKVENWQVQAPVTTGTPTITNVVLTATPQTETVPFNSLIEFGADNTGDANVTINLVIDGVVESSLEIPAGGSASFAISKGFPNPGSFLVEFAGESLTITANGNDVTGDYEGWIEIDSAAVDDTEEEFPSAEIYVLNTPSQDSDCSGGNEFNVDWKSNEYCILIATSMNRSTLATAVAGSLDSQASGDGLDATNPGLSQSGHPIIRLASQTAGTADNGEEIVFGVPSILEQNGGIFSAYTVNLSGGVDEYIVSEEIDILIGGSIFATTSAITALETADSIAQKIYDACVAVGSGTYTFAKNGTRVLVGSTSGEETLDLDIKNAGFSYSKQNIEEV